MGEALGKLRDLAASRAGYQVVVGSHRGYPDCCQTHYLISHKGRAVGAVCVCDDGEEIVPTSPWEPREWLASDRRDTGKRIGGRLRVS